MKFITRLKKILTVGLLLFGVLSSTRLAAQEINLSTLRPISQKVLNKYGEGINFEQLEPFSRSEIKNPKIDKELLSRYNYVAIDPAALSAICREQHEAIRLTLPVGESKMTMLLLKSKVLSDGFATYTSGDEGKPQKYEPGVYYRGIIEGETNSLVAISFFKDEVIGMASSEISGNIILSQTEQKGTYLIYSDRDLNVRNPASCGATEPENYEEEIAKYANNFISTRDQKCFKQYIECDYALFLNKGSVSAVNNWITAVYNNVAALYENEDIPTQISEIYVWTTQDPYNINSSYSALTKFKSMRPTFNGDVAQLAALGGNNIGGIAWVNSLCSSFNYSYANIYANYSNVPVYSWTVEVMTHEIGHNLGSPHTHSCSWVGGALDNCYPVEGSCNPGPPPTNGGTIMSYCHLTSSGINFNNGFGPQPGALIRAKVSSASCLGFCEEQGTESCDPPQTVTISNITNSSALVSWSNVLHATQYVLEYKQTLSSTWIALPPQATTSKQLTGLNAGTSYQVRVKAICTETVSNYSSVYNFTTGNTCSVPVGLIAVNITESSATVRWEAVSGATSYDFRYKLNTNSYWNTINITGNQVSFSGLTANTAYDVSVRARCESVMSNYTPTLTFVTLGPPEDPDGYCSSYGLNSTFEWIESIKLDSYQKITGNNGGYGDFFKEQIPVTKNLVSLFTGETGMIGNNTVYWTIWIDWNQNGSLNDPGEKVGQFITNNSTPITHKVLIPSTALEGKTWMRVQMKRGGYSSSCEVFPFGEVEEYSIIVLQREFNGGAGSLLQNISAYPNPFTDELSLEFESGLETSAVITVTDINGKNVISRNIHTHKGQNLIRLEETGALSAGVYVVRVAGQNINEAHKVIKLSGSN